MDLTAEQARLMVEETYKIIPLKVYNIYSCGHVIPKDHDPLKIKHRKGFRFRGCPENGCFGQFVTKYKLCDCDEKIETVGTRIKEGPCAECVYKKHNSKPRSRPAPLPDDGADEKVSAKIKAELAAITAAVKRSDCKRRAGCLSDVCKNIWAKTLPCLGCERYKMGAGGIDAMDATFRNGLAARRMITR